MGGSFCQTPLVETQVNYQENLSDNCVVLLYDPIATCGGTLNVKAYQLSEQFISSYRGKTNAYFSPASILIELPLKIRNPGLITALLFDIYSSPFPMRQQLYATTNLDDVADASWNAPPTPPRLDSLLITNQIQQYCARI